MVFLLAGLGAVAAGAIPQIERSRVIAAFCAGAAAILAVPLLYNLHYFGNVLGGYGGKQQGIQLGFLAKGLPGLLASPNRGLLVFTPVAIVGIFGMIRALRRPSKDPVLAAFSIAAIAFALLHAAFYTWAGGWSFGPRYLTELMPILALASASILPKIRKTADSRWASLRSGRFSSRSTGRSGTRRRTGTAAWETISKAMRGISATSSCGRTSSPGKRDDLEGNVLGRHCRLRRGGLADSLSLSRRTTENRWTVRRRSRTGLAILAVALLAAACGREPSSPPAEGANALPDSAFRVSWGVSMFPIRCRPGRIALASVTFKNASPDTWPDRKSSGGSPPGAGAVRLSYRWWRPGSPLPTSYEARADLREPLRPGNSTTLSFPITAPKTPGDYELQFDLVQELVVVVRRERRRFPPHSGQRALRGCLGRTAPANRSRTKNPQSSPETRTSHRLQFDSAERQFRLRFFRISIWTKFS